jgi:hypothetical protein
VEIVSIRKLRARSCCETYKRLQRCIAGGCRTEILEIIQFAAHVWYCSQTRLQPRGEAVSQVGPVRQYARNASRTTERIFVKFRIRQFYEKHPFVSVSIHTGHFTRRRRRVSARISTQFAECLSERNMFPGGVVKTSETHVILSYTDLP